MRSYQSTLVFPAGDPFSDRKVTYQERHSCHPFQGSISFLPLYSKHHLDGNVGGPVIEGAGKGSRSVVRANPNPNSRPALTVRGAALTLRLSVSRPLWEGSCLSVWWYFTGYVLRNWRARCPVSQILDTSECASWLCSCLYIFTSLLSSIQSC